jgi:uncharacterized protein YndB with AHSA1/START domain
MTGNAHSRIFGSLRSAGGTGVVRLEDGYDTEIDDLWEALTDPARLARWYGAVEGDLRPCGQFRTYNAADDIEGVGRVDACDPPRRLLVTSRETEESYRRGQGVPPHDKTIEATLTADGDQTVLVIEVQGMPLDKIAFFGAGWQIHAENLAGYLAGRDAADIEARWDQLVPPLPGPCGQDRHQLNSPTGLLSAAGFAVCGWALHGATGGPQTEREPHPKHGGQPREEPPAGHLHRGWPDTDPARKSL